MAVSRSATALLLVRRFSKVLVAPPSAAAQRTRLCPFLRLLECPGTSDIPLESLCASRSFCSGGTSSIEEQAEGPSAIDYRSLMQEDEYHKLANSTIHDLLEKLEEYGDSIQIDGFDIDYGNEVLTLKLGDLGTYVINKQTPNRQIWLSSPVSGPSRYDWDPSARGWVYRRNKANLMRVLESELEKLCGKSINLS